jgi:UDP-2,3-diacylglucosamine pyrophosphatase LpxH
MNWTGSFRTIWVSDLHLGTRSSQADRFLDFLRNTESDYLYLVGDIVDGWALRRDWYWPQAHNDVVQKLLRKTRKGTQVVYIPGNHDEFARHFVDLRLGGIEIDSRRTHQTADGQKLLVLHGDEFDGLLSQAKWLMKLGSRGYDLVLALNRVINPTLSKLGRPHWSLSQFAKRKSKQAVQFIADFENLVIREAQNQSVDGVVCGHIHKPEMRRLGNVLYANSGDWVESCSALVEHSDGRLELIDAARGPKKGTVPISDRESFGSTIGRSWICHLQE